MSSEGLSPTVKEFLRRYIESVAQMEILALVSTEPEREWSARDIDQVLRINEELIGRRLIEFARAGVLAQTGNGAATYQYRPREAALLQAADETVLAYRTRPVLVIETIFKPGADPAQSFADAFRIRPPS